MGNIELIVPQIEELKMLELLQMMKQDFIILSKMKTMKSIVLDLMIRAITMRI